MIWTFGDFELDERLFQLRRRGRVLRVEPKVFDVLLHLLRHRDRVVSKDELLDALWPGQAVSESVLPRCIAAARRVTGDERARPRVIETVHGRGYRFVASAAPSAPTGPVPAARPRERASGPARFVGREAPLARLRSALTDTIEGRGRVVLLVGEPGIGKTRTAEELAAEAQPRGALWLAGRCLEDASAPAFWPFAQALRSLAAHPGARELAQDLGPGAADLAELAPELREVVRNLPAARDLAGDQGRFRLFESAADVLRRLARRTPVVLTLDDLHWADADSLLLFGFLAAELAGARVLLLGTYRDVEVRRDHPLARLLGDLARHSHCERIALRGLARAEVAALVEAVAGAAPKPELAAAVAEMTDGNPFFVHEVARFLAEEGRLEGESATALDLVLPQGVRDAIGRRLDSLSPECNTLLRRAAVLGREFGRPFLERIAGSDGEALLELLGEALAAQVLVEPPDAPGRFAFRHALVRQTLLEELPVAQRAALHRSAAEALEAFYAARPDAPLAELAHHFLSAASAGSAERAVHYSVRAAERDFELCAYDESARHCERALAALEMVHPPDAARRAELLVMLGETLWTGGHRSRAREQLGEAADLARGLSRPDLLARAAIAYRGFGEMGLPADAKTLTLLEEANAGLGDSHPALRAQLLARMAGTPPWSLSMQTRERLARESHALAERSGDRPAESEALGARYWSLLGPDRIDQREAVAREARAQAARSGDRRLELLAIEIALGVHLLRGEIGKADLEVEAYARLAEELRQPFFRFMAESFRASRAILAGELEQAGRRIDEMAARWRGTAIQADLVCGGLRFWLDFQRGELVGFAAALEEVSPVLRAGLAGAQAILDTLLALGALAAGRSADAKARFEALAANDFADLERDEQWLLTTSALALLAIELGDAERSRRLYALLAPYADLTVCHDLMRAVAGSVESVLGSLAGARGLHGEAVAHLERGLACEERMGARVALPRTRIGLARALLARGAPGDRARAARLEREARAEAGRLGIRLFQAAEDARNPA